MLTIQSILADNYADPNFNAKQLSEALDLPSWQVLRNFITDTVEDISVEELKVWQSYFVSC